ncbi:hypothetical protein SALWKB12_1693 [Snodgrassella communis]|nr:hypothetical protein SALWKB12_1693 [Snodgrassella communis]
MYWQQWVSIPVICEDLFIISQQCWSVPLGWPARWICAVKLRKAVDFL